MPVSLTSRYHGSPIYPVDDLKRGPTASVAIRERPAQSGAPYRHTVTGSETMEYLAFRFYGRSDAWWRIAEANPLVFPHDLRAGVSLDVPGTDDVGRVQRTRRF